MTPITLKRLDEDYPEDVTQIQLAVLNHGYACSRKEAQDLWLAYSDSLCAGWLILPHDAEHIWVMVAPFIERDARS